jgi:hypothetical protein
MALCVDKLNTLLGHWDTFEKNNTNMDLNYWKKVIKQEDRDNNVDAAAAAVAAEDEEQKEIKCNSNNNYNNGCKDKMREFGNKTEKAILHYNTKCAADCDYNKGKCVVNKFQCGREGHKNFIENQNSVKEQLQNTKLYLNEEIEQIINDNNLNTKIQQNMNK